MPTLWRRRRDKRKLGALPLPRQYRLCQSSSCLPVARPCNNQETRSRVQSMSTFSKITVYRLRLFGLFSQLRNLYDNTL